MATSRPEPEHAPDDAQQETRCASGSAPVISSPQTGAKDAILEDEAAELAARLAGRRSLAESLRDVLALPAVGPNTKRVTFVQLENPDHLLHLMQRFYHRRASVADAFCIGAIVKGLERGPQAISALREVADRLDGPVTQKLKIEGETDVLKILVEHRTIPLPELLPEAEANGAS